MQIITREHWGARLRTQSRMKFPVSHVFIHHSVTTDYLDDFKRTMKAIERIGEQRFGIISYSYVGTQNGHVLEGAGDTIGAHTVQEFPIRKDWNPRALGYCLAGNFNISTPNMLMVAAFRLWRRWAVETGRLTPEHTILPHRSVKATACPGNNTIKMWAAFTSPLPSQTTNPEDDMIRIIQDGYGTWWHVTGNTRWRIGADVAEKWGGLKYLAPSSAIEYLPRVDGDSITDPHPQNDMANLYLNSAKII